MKNVILYFILSFVLISSNCFSETGFDPTQYPTTYEQWVRERVGPVAYPAPENDPVRSWSKFLELVKETKFQADKTWLGSKEPGEAVKKLQLPHYIEIFDAFNVIHINYCSEYINNGLVDGKLKPETLKGIEQDWYDCASYLYKKYENQDKVFLFSACAELNAYMGTKGHNESLPVSDYVNTCQKGLERARNEFGDHSKSKIYSVAEIQCEVEYDAFIKKFVPTMKADLYSLSFYCFYKDLSQTLDYLGQYAPPSKIFGKNNLIIGEFGPSIEHCNWDENARIRYYDTLLKTAFQKKAQFAFFYELVDTDFVINSAGHLGLYGWNSSAIYKRKLWDYFYTINTGGMAYVPTESYRETIPWINDTTVANAANLTITKIEINPKHPIKGESVTFSALIKNIGTQNAGNPCVHFYVDDYLASWDCIGNSLKPGESSTFSSVNQNPKFTWQAKSGKHSITVLVNPKNSIKESNKEDNFKTIYITIP